MTEADFAGADTVLRSVDGMRPSCVLGSSAFARLCDETFERFELGSILGLRLHLWVLLRLRGSVGHTFSEVRGFLPCVFAVLRFIVGGIDLLPYLVGYRSGCWLFVLLTLVLLAILLLFLLVLALLLVLMLQLILSFVVSIFLLVTVLFVVLTLFAILLVRLLSILVPVLATFALLITLVPLVGVVKRFLLLISLVGVTVELL